MKAPPRKWTTPRGAMSVGATTQLLPHLQRLSSISTCMLQGLLMHRVLEHATLCAVCSAPESPT